MKKCKRCERTLPLDAFRMKGKHPSYLCRECEREYWHEYDANRREDNLIDPEQTNEILVKRQYKKIDSQRILDVSDIGIPLAGDDEIFVLLPDSVDYYLSNYGRCIRILPDGVLRLMIGNGDTVTIIRSHYQDGGFVEQSDHIDIAAAVVREFIENPDTVRNTRIWNAGDGFYYKNLYPLSTKQYAAVRQFHDRYGYTDEKVVLSAMNDRRFDPDDWSPSYLRRRVCGIGYYGCSDVDTASQSYKRWKDMLLMYGGTAAAAKTMPQHADMEICEEWLNYSNFRKWWDENAHTTDGVKMVLSFHILFKDNKVISPATAAVVPHPLSSMLTYRHKDNKGLPIGIYYDKRYNRYRAESHCRGQQVKLGDYSTPEAAGEAYRNYKLRLIRKMSEEYRYLISYGVYRSLKDWEL